MRVTASASDQAVQPILTSLALAAVPAEVIVTPTRTAAMSRVIFDIAYSLA